MKRKLDWIRIINTHKRLQNLNPQKGGEARAPEDIKLDKCNLHVALARSNLLGRGKKK